MTTNSTSTDGPSGIQTRAIVPISVKLIFTTTLLLVAVAASSAFYSQRTLDRMAEDDAAARRASGEAAIISQSELIARNVGTPAALQLADGNYADVQSLIDKTVAEDARIEWLLLADTQTGRVVARSAGAPKLETLRDELSDGLRAARPNQVLRIRDAQDPTRLTFGANVSAGNRALGELRMGVTTQALEDELAQAIAAGRERARDSARKLLFSAAAILLVGLLLAFFQGYRMTRPLHLLSETAARIAAGDLQSRVQVSSRDEIGLLATNFNYMTDQLAALLQETATKASLEKEMSLAREIQEAMLPQSTLISHGPFRVIGHAETATYCGGDWWNVRKLSADRLLLIVGDVTGHGMPAAMIVATARGAVEALAEAGEQLLTPTSVLSAIDTAVSNVGNHSLHMTCFAALIDPRAGRIDYSNAGHNFPYLVRQDDERQSAQLLSLVAAGNPLGDKERRLIRSGQQALRPGDLVACYTDGLIDRLNQTGLRFGEKRLRELLTRTPLTASENAVQKLKDEIIDEMTGFAGGEPPDDDVTLVLVQYEPPVAAAVKAQTSEAGQQARP
jgi:sigma-B regulation protein RsbU (phosphoserine phosphatase)